jgi:small subunit ribosomal protein S1
MADHRDEDFATMLAHFQEERRDPQIGEKVTGTIVSIGDEVAFVDFGAKSEGTVDRAELVDEDGRLTVAVGDRIEARAAAVDASGNFVLRVRPGRGETGRSELELAFQQGLAVEGLVTAEVKGGVEVTIGGQRAFCPVSQLDRRYVESPGEFVGQRLQFRIRTFEPKGRHTNVVVSRRALLEEEAERQADELRERLKPGAVLDATVTSLTSYGAFVDLGGLEGLLHVSEMSHRRGVDPREVLRQGQRVEVQVLQVDPPQKAGQKERISLSTRALERDPWEGAERRFPAGAEVAGRVTHLESYGAFVELEPGIEGLVHVSRLGGKDHPRHAREVVELGQTLELRVLEVDLEKRRISLARKVGEPSDEERREVESYQQASSSSGGFGAIGDFFLKRRGLEDEDGEESP